jgi:hypothetical protein
MKSSLKKLVEPEGLPSQEDLHLRYREVQLLRMLVSRLETSVFVAVPQAAFEGLIEHFTATTPAIARVLTTDELHPQYKRRAEMETLH